MPTLLDSETLRPDGDALRELGNGLVVRLLCEPDENAEAEYPGSYLWWAIESCLALVEEFDEEFGDLPMRSRIVLGRRSHFAPVDRAYLAKLLSGRAPAAVPRFVIARWGRMQEDASNQAEIYAQTFVDGLLTVRIQIEVDGRPVVVRSIAGVPSGFANFDFLQAAISDAADEALELLGEHEGEHCNSH